MHRSFWKEDTSPRRPKLSTGGQSGLLTSNSGTSCLDAFAHPATTGPGPTGCILGSPAQVSGCRLKLCTQHLPACKLRCKMQSQWLHLRSNSQRQFSILPCGCLSKQTWSSSPHLRFWVKWKLRNLFSSTLKVSHDEHLLCLQTLPVDMNSSSDSWINNSPWQSSSSLHTHTCARMPVLPSWITGLKQEGTASLSTDRVRVIDKIDTCVYSTLFSYWDRNCQVGSRASQIRQVWIPDSNRFYGIFHMQYEHG